MISNFFAYFDGISQGGGKIRAMAFGQSSNHLSARELEGERWFAGKGRARRVLCCINFPMALNSTL